MSGDEGDCVIGGRLSLKCVGGNVLLILEVVVKGRGIIGRWLKS